MRILFIFVAALLVAHGSGHAQASPHVCGSLPDAADELEDLAPYFVAQESARFRASLHLEQVRGDAVQGVVRDARVCGRLYPQVLQKLRTRTNWRDLQHAGFDFTVLRYGPYYAVLVVEAKPLGEFSEMMIFRTSDFGYVGSGLV